MRTILYSLAVFLIFLPVAAFAQDDNNLVNLPIGETGDFNDYINAVYLMFISIAALIAVVKIIIAGVKYMFSDIVTQKSDAKNDIKGALLGLLVVLSAVVILTIINPDLTTFDPDITRNEARDQVTNQPSLTASDVQTVKEFCAANDGACATSPCRRLGTSWSPIGFAVNTTINAVSCDLLCSGEVVGETCLYVSGEVPVNLPELTETSIIPCIEGNGVVEVTCEAARNTCINGYGGTAEGIDTNGVLQISCTPPPDTEIFDCTNLGFLGFNCRLAKKECTGGRTATQNDSGQIVCEVN
jgi:hypothetical protein